MNGSRNSKKGAVLAALIGTTLLAAYPAQGQNTLNRVSTVDVEAGLNDVLITRLQDPADETLAATLQPVNETLRAQLDIPAGQGLLVTGLRDDGASAQAGLKQNDILLSLGDKPLAAADDLAKQLKAAGESAVPLKILRAGKPIVIQVRPIYRVTLGPVAEQKAEYYLGVTIDAADGAVRAQLALPDGQGVVVNEVVSGSPAEKAGVKKYDIVLELDGKPIDSPQTLARQVQAVQDKPTTLKLLRAGKPVTIPVTGTVRQVEASPPRESVRWWMVDPSASPDNTLFLNLARRSRLQELSAPANAEDLRQRLDHVEKELKALRAAVDKVSETLKANKGTKRD